MFEKRFFLLSRKKKKMSEKRDGIKSYYQTKIQEYSVAIKTKQMNLKRLEAQRNELNNKGKVYKLVDFSF